MGALLVCPPSSVWDTKGGLFCDGLLFCGGGGIVVLVLIFLLKGCVPVMGISVSDFVPGGFIVTTEGPEGSYGLYQVLSMDGMERAELVDVGGTIPNRVRCMLANRSSEQIDDVFPQSFMMHRRVVWGNISNSISGGECFDPVAFVDVIRVFAGSEREAAVEYFNALVRARKVLGKVRSGKAVAPLNLNASNPHAIELSNVESVTETLQERELAGLVGFETECNKLLSEMNFETDKAAVDAFKGKVAAEPPRYDFTYYILCNDEVDLYVAGFFRGDIVRFDNFDGVQYLQVIGGDKKQVLVKNLDDESQGFLKIVSDLDEDWYDDEEEYYDTFIHLVKPDGTDDRGGITILPTRNPELVSDFETIYEAQDAPRKKFGDGIMERLIGFNETMRHRPDSFVVGITYSEQIELLEDINSLNCDAMWSGDIERLQTLEKQVRTLIESKLESVREAVYDLCGEVSEALVKVATLNAK